MELSGNSRTISHIFADLLEKANGVMDKKQQGALRPSEGVNMSISCGINRKLAVQEPACSHELYRVRNTLQMDDLLQGCSQAHKIARREAILHL